MRLKVYLIKVSSQSLRRPLLSGKWNGRNLDSGLNVDGVAFQSQRRIWFPRIGPLAQEA